MKTKTFIIYLLISIVLVFIAFLLADTYLTIASGGILGTVIVLKILLGKKNNLIPKTMRTFKHFNSFNTSDVCPICGTNNDKEVILVPIKGTEEGNNIQAIQVHTDCLNCLVFDKEIGIIYTVADKT